MPTELRKGSLALGKEGFQGVSRLGPDTRSDNHETQRFLRKTREDKGEPSFLKIRERERFGVTPKPANHSSLDNRHCSLEGGKKGHFKYRSYIHCKICSKCFCP